MKINNIPRRFKITPFTEYFLYANYSVTSIMILLNKNLVDENDAIFSVVGACFSIFVIKIYSKFFSNTKRNIKQIMGVFLVMPAPVTLLALSKHEVITAEKAYLLFEVLSLFTIGLIIFLTNKTSIGLKNAFVKSTIGVGLYFIYFEGLEYLKSILT